MPARGPPSKPTWASKESLCLQFPPVVSQQRALLVSPSSIFQDIKKTPRRRLRRGAGAFAFGTGSRPCVLAASEAIVCF